MRRFFRSPVFPPQPNLGHVITKTEGPYDMGDVDPETGETISRMVDTVHLHLETQVLLSDPVYQGWFAAVLAVRLPWWWRLWCWLRRRPTRPAVNTWNVARDAIPQVIFKNTVVHLEGRYECVDAVIAAHVVKGACLVFDGGKVSDGREGF